MRRPLNRRTANAPRTHPIKIIQFGGGNFLRGFVDWMVDVLNEQASFDGSVVVVRPTNRGPYTALNAQEGLFHLVLNGVQAGRVTSETLLVRSIHSTVQPYDDYAAYLALAEMPTARFVVSNTTEAGLEYVPEERPGERSPRSFPGKLTALLHRRFEHFGGAPKSGWIVLPCELIDDNGARLRAIVLRYAEAWELGDAFRGWVEAHCVFCNTLVDRIVTGYPHARAEAILEALGYEDRLLTAGEPYHLWAVEAPKWVQEELPFHRTDLNVHFVPDLRPYRTQKVRLLNGAHTAMTPIGLLAGIETVRGAVEDEQVGGFVRGLLFEEIIPTVDLPEAQLRDYAARVLERFANPYIEHRLAAIALNSIPKWRVRLLPTLLTHLERFGRLPPRTVLALAALLRFYRGDWQGEALPVQDDDRLVRRVQAAWANEGDARLVAARLLQDTALWEANLARLEGLVGAVADHLTAIEAGGIRDGLVRFTGR